MRTTTIPRSHHRRVEDRPLPRPGRWLDILIFLNMISYVVMIGAITSVDVPSYIVAMWVIPTLSSVLTVALLCSYGNRYEATRRR